MEVNANSDSASLPVVSSVCDLQVAWGLTMIAPFERGMDIVYRISSATNNSESAGSIAGF